MCYCGVVDLASLAREGPEHEAGIAHFHSRPVGCMEILFIWVFECGVLFTSLNPQNKWHSVQVRHWSFPSPKGGEKILLLSTYKIPTEVKTKSDIAMFTFLFLRTIDPYPLS